MAHPPLILNRAIGGSAGTVTKDNNTGGRKIYSHRRSRRIGTDGYAASALQTLIKSSEEWVNRATAKENL
jgi:hypothetical protein